MAETYHKHIEDLYQRQFMEWKELEINYNDLKGAQIKMFPFDGFSVKLQCNPKRIVSSAARIDQQSINQRPCFLCEKNRPSQQKEIGYKNNHILLINPYPIFERHLTIPSLKHVSQRIIGNFGTMLQLARDLEQYVIIYNGPTCGASAPDHFHFQAVPVRLLPIEHDFHTGERVKEVGSFKELRIFTWDHYLRNLITLVSDKLQVIRGAFGKLYKIMETELLQTNEPMMNIITLFDGNRWIVHVFPRRLHRPTQYFAPGREQILLSPASIDMGGLLVLPREDDFNKITPGDVADIYRQVCVDDQCIQRLVIQMINDDD
jgi:ATP adenylyltransferase/5',5'''-P-1,P-4-tetraphosphate phosphorylase II